MRTIKFRVWVKDHQSYLKDFEYTERIKTNHQLGLGNYIYEQSTGLKDMYGNEIYEGDIIKVGDTCSFVVYCDVHAGFIFNSYMEKGLIHNLYKAATLGYVIGNKFENPELLKN